MPHDAVPVLDQHSYHQGYEQSLKEPGVFWREQAMRFLDWQHPWRHVAHGDFPSGHMSWFQGGRLNVCHNCVDRHLPDRADQTALIWVGQDNTQHITYAALHKRVLAMTGVLQGLGVKAGDRVAVCMPMIPDTAVVLLACARMGAVHAAMCAAWSPQALYQHMVDTQATLLVTADGARCSDHEILLKSRVDHALALGPHAITQVLVCQNTHSPVPWSPLRDRWLHELLPHAHPAPCPAWDAEAPLSVVPTSGAAGSPKSVLHTQAGYLLYASMTFQYVFGYQEGEVCWCTADVAEIVGQTYSLYGPLSRGATLLWYEGLPTERSWSVMDEHNVAVFYTTPMVLQQLRAAPPQALQSSRRNSLRLLATVGEPISPEIWRWCHDEVGRKRCPVIDTWCQTETGGIVLASLPHVAPLKPGSVGVPFFGILPGIMTEEGLSTTGKAQGPLVLATPWPGLMQGLHNPPEGMNNPSFSLYPGVYATHDEASRDAQGHYSLQGRTDDLLHLSGHRVGSAEVEAVVGSLPEVVEVAAVGTRTSASGEALVVCVHLRLDTPWDEAIQQRLRALLKKHLGACVPVVMAGPPLPRTHSGRLMRRLLRSAIEGTSSTQDTSTLANQEDWDAWQACWHRTKAATTA